MLNVLLVESGAKIQNQLLEALKKIRFNVTTTNWASDVLPKLNEHNIDLVLIRSKLEDSTASECVKHIRSIQKYAHFPVCIIYGKMSSGERMDAWRSGADDVISMPFVLPELLIQVYVRLQKTRQHKTLEIPLSLGINQEKVSEKDDNDYNELPRHGTINSLPFPRILSLAWIKCATGVLRLIEGKHIRSFYIKNGYVCGTNSTIRDEFLHRYLLKSSVFPGETKREFKQLSDTMPDNELIMEFGKVIGVQQETLDAIVVRYLTMIAHGAFHTVTGEYDWTPDDSPDSFCLLGYQGVHPVQLLLAVLRTSSNPPPYTRILSNRELLLVPCEKAALLKNTCSLTLSELCVISSISAGMSLANWLRQSRIVLPYAESFMYLLFLFKYFCTCEKSELDPDEILAVALPGSGAESRTTLFDPAMSMIDVDDLENEAIESSEPQHSGEHCSEDDDRIVNLTRKSRENQSHQKQIIKPSVSAMTPSESILERELREINTQQTTSHHRIRKPGHAQPPSQPVRETSSSPQPFSDFKMNDTNLLKGHIWETHPAVIISMAIQHKVTGVLTFSDAASESRMFWQAGKLVYAKTTKQDLRIDHVLFNMGLISDAQKKEAADLWDTSGGMRAGTALIRMKMINPMDLTEAVKEQIRLIIEDICAMPAGDYCFATGDLPLSEYVAFDISTERVFTRSLRSLEDSGDLAVITASLNKTFVVTPNAVSKAHDAHLEGIDISILNRFRQPATLKTAFLETDISLPVFKNTITALFLLNYLEMSGL